MKMASITTIHRILFGIKVRARKLGYHKNLFTILSVTVIIIIIIIRKVIIISTFVLVSGCADKIKPLNWVRYVSLQLRIQIVV